MKVLFGLVHPIGEFVPGRKTELMRINRRLQEVSLAGLNHFARSGHVLACMGSEPGGSFALISL